MLLSEVRARAECDHPQGKAPGVTPHAAALRSSHWVRRVAATAGMEATYRACCGPWDYGFFLGAAVLVASQSLVVPAVILHAPQGLPKPHAGVTILLPDP